MRKIDKSESIYSSVDSGESGDSGDSGDSGGPGDSDGSGDSGRLVSNSGKIIFGFLEHGGSHMVHR